MSTSILYHAFEIREYVYMRTRHKDGSTVFEVERGDLRRLRCPQCRSYDVTRKGIVVRRLRMEPIGMRQNFLEVSIQRVACAACGVTRQVSLPFADPRSSYTRRFERYALELSKVMTIGDVASHLGISWDTVKEFQKRYLRKRFEKPKVGKLKLLAVDEIHVGKLTFLTVVMDLKTGAVVFVGDGKDSEALAPFWQRLKRARARIQAVAMDMGRAFIHAVRRNLPEATIVFDHFHVIKLFNERLSQLRRDEQKKADDQGKEVLKGTRWLLLKRPRNLDDERNEAERLREALEANQSLATAYYMKEDLGRIWRQMDRESAAFLLDDWIKRAVVSGIGMLVRFAKTLVAHREGVLAYYDFDGISTGPLEGMNNKIGLLQRRAYGFSDMEFFKLKIMALHEATAVLIG
ncbi:MAG: ISL3 family transposase [Magnetococcales bacterium]|nr:ISL3 family transposase [Magnetococcales bacterium]